MVNVLLITDNARVKKVFEALELQGVLQLRTAVTLAQGDLEISASPPAFTFVQSRISGFSSEIVLHHLKKILPKNAKIALMAADAEELQDAQKLSKLSLDLSQDPEKLEAAILKAITPRTAARNKAGGDAAHGGSVDRVSLSSSAVPFEDFQYNAPAPAPAPLRGEPAPAPAPEPTPESRATAMRSGFQELLQETTQKEPPIEFPEIGDFSYGRPLAEVMRSAQQEQRRFPGWFMPLSVAVVGISIICFYAGRREALRQEAALAPTPYLAARPPAHAPAPPARPTLAQVPPSATRPAAVPKEHPQPAAKMPVVAQGGTAPASRPLPAPAAITPAKPSVQPSPAPPRGVEKLPSFMSQTKLDPSYGKTHPGWQRYVGVIADYKVYREASLIKALQVIAKGEKPLPEGVLKRALQHFGGDGNYQVQSRNVQKNYLVERGAARGGVGITIYRKKTDLRMKGLVLYFR